MIEAGADLVIGNHPHWAQPAEVFKNNKVVAYALGNFSMDQPWSTETQQGIVFEANFRGKKLESWNLRPIHIYSGYQPRWASAEESATILARLNSAFELAPLFLRKYQHP
jgi:poly-gamma-glutamate capsule biosynthesis protein CapA/YwtB (metallophosphatase superfamily)